ncbi:MAG TPA: hypothetical protein VHW64_17720 [Nocardioides sp.]|uniref:hypothetical protein n=1 Tax=Nocardioides sp. TaxID=35761 RepID=UPI002E309035|nr:hypothetical protein [Nocardioides sp.]HEX3932538.1 hypothetical protein [Nocardioides sp.]
MPTTKPRHQVTETPAVAHALDLAAQRWPGHSRGALVTLLLVEGAKTIEDDHEQVRETRRELVDRLAGGFDDAFPNGFLEQLRQDWPE